MKNIHIILSILLGAMIGLTSCHREDIPYNDIPEESAIPISFSTIHASLDTKADDGEATTPAISAFHVWASRKYGSSSNQSTNNLVFGQYGDDVTYSNNAWVYSPVRYWQTGSYNFIAASHTTEITTSFTGSLTTDNDLVLNFDSPGWNLSSTPADLILATATATGDTQLSNPTNVQFSFDHQLSKVKFSAKNVDTRDASISVTGVTVKGNHHNATRMTYTMSSTPSRSWSFADNGNVTQTLPLQVEGENTAILLNKTTPVGLTTDVLMFSENCDLEVTVNFDVTINGKTASESKSATILSTAWQGGKIYEYQINLTSDNITFVVHTVTDWVKVGSVTDNDIPF